MKTFLKYSLLVLALSLTVVPSAFGGPHSPPPPPPPNPPHQGPPPPPRPTTAPEVDPSLAISGLALLVGSLSVAHARRSKG
jgi:hypothetical protein